LLSKLKLYIFIEFIILKKHIECKLKNRWYYKYLSPNIVQAFTLAEVLITLLIIGIISSIVIPALIADTQQAEFITAWKKTYSVVDQATRRVMMDNGGTLIGAIQGPTDMVNKYSYYLNYTKKCIDDTSCWHLANNWFWYNKSIINYSLAGYGFILNDGTNIIYSHRNSDCSNTLYSGNIQTCGWIFVDVNGFKGPNTIDKDIFYIYILKDRIVPRGIPGDSAGNTTCPAGGGCSAKYLYQ